MLSRRCDAPVWCQCQGCWAMPPLAMNHPGTEPSIAWPWTIISRKIIVIFTPPAQNVLAETLNASTESFLRWIRGWSRQARLNCANPMRNAGGVILAPWSDLCSGIDSGLILLPDNPVSAGISLTQCNLVTLEQIIDNVGIPIMINITAQRRMQTTNASSQVQLGPRLCPQGNYAQHFSPKSQEETFSHLCSHQWGQPGGTGGAITSGCCKFSSGGEMSPNKHVTVAW